MKAFRPGFAKVLGLLFLLLARPLLAAESPWARVVVIGASASAGFVLAEPFGGTNTARCKLNHYLDAAITPPHAPVKNVATAMFFLSTDALAKLEIESATNQRPTLVIGVDFLFWFCYGEAHTEAERARHFETGLRFLEQIPCPLVIGDVPDASAATNTGIISSEQVPSEACRNAANRRLKEWAAQHPNVTVVPLAKFMQATMANAAISIHGQNVPAGKSRALLQPDQLHPGPRGATLLALEILDGLTARQPKFPAADIRWAQEEVLQNGLKSASRPAAAKPGPFHQ